jgi:putative peptidoglycan lipid II flippase
MTILALVCYSIGLPADAMSDIVYRVFYALQDTKTTMKNSFVVVGTNILFNILLIKFMGHAGLALASSIAAIVGTTTILIRLRKRIGPFGFYETVICMGKALLAAVAMGIVIYTLDKFIYIGDTKWHEFAKLIITGGSGLLVYVGIVYAMGVVEIKWFFGLVMEKLGKRK